MTSESEDRSDEMVRMWNQHLVLSKEEGEGMNVVSDSVLTLLDGHPAGCSFRTMSNLLIGDAGRSESCIGQGCGSGSGAASSSSCK